MYPALQPTALQPRKASYLVQPDFPWAHKLPADALPFGVGADGKPVLLHLRDPRPGPVLVMADHGSGKTAFLRALIQAADLFKEPGRFRFDVLTEYPDEWRDLHTNQAVNVWDIYGQNTDRYLYDLACDVQMQRLQAPTLLLVDGLDAILEFGQQSLGAFQYVLEHGPNALVWPICTATPAQALRAGPNPRLLRTVIRGRITHPVTGENLTPDASGLPGPQFFMRKGDDWVPFWMPWNNL